MKGVFAKGFVMAVARPLIHTVPIDEMNCFMV